MNDDINAVSTSPTKLSKWGEITPLKVREIPSFSRAISPIAGQVFEIFKSGIKPADLVNLVGEHGELVIQAVAIASRLEQSVLDDMEIDEFIELTVLVLEVNVDFFIHRLMPVIEQSVDHLNKVVTIPDGGQSASA